MELSKKSVSIGASPTLELDAKEKKMRSEGIDVVGFCAGQPDFDTPDNIKQAAIKAINEGFTKYTPTAGDLGLQKAICKKFLKDNNLSYEPDNIVVSNGAKHSLYNVFQAICNPGDEVIIPGPCWVSYPEMVKMAYAQPVILNSSEEDGFKITIGQLEKAVSTRTKAIIINSPCNPTGMIYTPSELEAIAAVAVQKGIFVVSDEIYEKFIYDSSAKQVSIASFNDRIKDLSIVVNGVSKTYSMTGWRIGYSASNLKIAKVMSNMQSHATSNPNSIAQKASLEALTGPQESIGMMVAEFKRRRDYMVNRINSIPGLSCLKPGGAFYVMMNISKIIGSKKGGTVIDGSDTFARILLEKVNVALVPGSGFGSAIHVRLSYATSMETITKGMDRIEKFMSA